jgi:hypothetical protein
MLPATSASRVLQVPEAVGHGVAVGQSVAHDSRQLRYTIDTRRFGNGLPDIIVLSCTSFQRFQSVESGRTIVCQADSKVGASWPVS